MNTGSFDELSEGSKREMFMTMFTLKERLIMNSKSYFLIAAFASFGLSVSLWFFGNAEIAKEQGIFVGLWVPSILTLGNYFCPVCDKG